MPREKITAYLLSPTHPVGRSKAAFFLRFGFTVERWQVLADALTALASSYTVVRSERTPFGERYVIEGRIHAPDGRSPWIQTVWMIYPDQPVPRFITAYPKREPSS